MDEANERAEVAATVGARLRAAREARGQSLDDIGKQTRVPVRHLVQIEEGRLEGLPAAPYSAGFVKAYARAVDLDPVALSQEFRSEFAAAAQSSPRVFHEPYEPADPNRLAPRPLAYVALAIAIVLAAGYGVWRSGALTGEGADERARLAANGAPAAPEAQTSQPAAAPAAPAPSAPAQPAPAPAGPVRLTALQPVWFRISERNGPTIRMGTLDKGQSYDVPATASDPVIRTGRPEALQVTVGGQVIPPLGEPAHTVSNVSLKAAALTARPAHANAAPAAAPAVPSSHGPSHKDIPAAFQAAASVDHADDVAVPQPQP